MSDRLNLGAMSAPAKLISFAIAFAVVTVVGFMVGRFL